MYKRHNIFLRKIPEYIRLERHDNPSMEELVNFELSNYIFLQIEGFLSEFQEREALAAGHRQDTAKRLMGKNASLRLRIMSITCTTTSKELLCLKHVHEILVEKAHRKGCINPLVDKMRKQTRHGRLSEVLEIDLRLKLVEDAEIYTNKKLKPSTRGYSKNSLILSLANLVKLISSYEYGILMGKKIQFDVIAFKSLWALKDSVLHRIEELRCQSSCFIGDILMKSLFKTALKCFQHSDRTSLVSLLCDTFKTVYPMSNSYSDKFDIKENSSRISQSLELVKVYHIDQILLHNQKQIFLDPDNLFIHLLKCAGYYMPHTNLLNLLNQEIQVIQICDESMMLETLNHSSFQSIDDGKVGLILITNHCHISKISNVPLTIFNFSTDNDLLEAVIFDYLFFTKGGNYFKLKKEQSNYFND